MKRNADYVRCVVVRRLLSPLVAGALVWASFAGSAAGQSSTPDSRIEQLTKKLQELEADLAAVKQELAQRAVSASASPVVPAAPVVAPAAPAVQTPAPVPSAPDASALLADTSQSNEHTLGPLEIRGYGDFGFGRPIFSALPAGGLTGSTSSFNLGDFDLFVNTRLGEHFSVLGELLITSDFTNEFGAEMDRLMLTYTANKYFKISGGKYHTAIG
jgi:hypothetical protein